MMIAAPPLRMLKNQLGPCLASGGLALELPALYPSTPPVTTQSGLSNTLSCDILVQRGYEAVLKCQGSRDFSLNAGIHRLSLVVV